MANKSKQQGTAYETEVVRRASARPHLRARRAENHAPGKDVYIVLNDGTELSVECKHRANLNVHKLLGEIGSRFVAWKRLSRKNGNVRRTADGPDVLVVPLDLGLAALGVVSAALAHVGAGGSLTDLHDAVVGFTKELVS